MSRRNILPILLAAASASACMVQITHVSDPEPLFRRARLEAEHYQGRRGPAHELNVLVFDPGERQVVRVSVPMWMVRVADRHVDWDKQVDGRAEDDLDREERIARRVRRHVRVEDIEKAGLGILAEVVDDDGEQVLVWLK
jgi:hypothetical protein